MAMTLQDLGASEDRILISASERILICFTAVRLQWLLRFVWRWGGLGQKGPVAHDSSVRSPAPRSALDGGGGAFADGGESVGGAAGFGDHPFLGVRSQVRWQY